MDIPVLGWATPAWRDAKARTRGFQTFVTELTDTLKSGLDRCALAFSLLCNVVFSSSNISISHFVLVARMCLRW